MRVIAIDASQRQGVVSRSVEIAARAAEEAGAHVERVRLSQLVVRSCTGCSMCHLTGACKIADDLPSLVDRMEHADAILLGTDSYFRHSNEATAALMERLATYFANDDRQMRLPGLGPAAVPQTPRVRSVKRAVIITACAMPEPLATFFGFTTGPFRELREALGHGGIRTIGSLAVTDTWRHPDLHEWEREKATSLGRVLAGKI
jgi:hypothetical protein